MDKLKTSPPPSRPESPLTLTSNPNLPQPTPYRPTRNSANAKRYKYLRRLLKFRQMDFEFAMWQMIYLFAAPQKVYRNFQYRKQTKDQFARDDPAFLVLLGFWLCVSSIGFALVLQLRVLEFVKFLSWVIFIDCIGVGIIIATVFWLVANRYLRKPNCRDQDVEWGYAFDVHLNAFFPLLIILHVFQLFFYHGITHLRWNPDKCTPQKSYIKCQCAETLPSAVHLLISHDWFISRLFGNTLWLIALGYYIYITFLGYSCLAILRNTQVLLYPMTVLIVFYIVTIAAGWNVGSDLMYFYKYRVL